MPPFVLWFLKGASNIYKKKKMGGITPPPFYFTIVVAVVAIRGKRGALPSLVFFVAIIWRWRKKIILFFNTIVHLCF
jgi:hypothetical protein